MVADDKRMTSHDRLVLFHGLLNVRVVKICASSNLIMNDSAQMSYTPRAHAVLPESLVIEVCVDSIESAIASVLFFFAPTSCSQLVRRTQSSQGRCR
jgi:hypothetical protein